MNIRAIALAGALLATSVPALPVSAQAAPLGWHGGGWHGGGWGLGGLGIGLAAGAIIGGIIGGGKGAAIGAGSGGAVGAGGAAATGKKDVKFPVETVLTFIIR